MCYTEKSSAAHPALLLASAEKIRETAEKPIDTSGGWVRMKMSPNLPLRTGGAADGTEI